MEKKLWWALSGIFALLFVVDMVIPDPLPFLDEILFAGVSGMCMYKAIQHKN